MSVVDDTPRTDEHGSSVLPPPLRAGIGLVAVGVDKARNVRHVRIHGIQGLSGLATLPLRGLGALVQARDTVERTYEELSNRGETIIARWRGRPEPRQTPEPLSDTTTPTLDEVVDPFGLPDAVHEAIEEAAPGATLPHDQLPLEDFDHLTLGSLRARLPRLDAVALVQLLDYERTHAHRLPVLTMLENRIAKIGKTP